MTIIQIGDYLVEQVPIEQIEKGETVLTHLPDGSPITFVVEIRRIVFVPATGINNIGLQAAPETDTHGVGLVASIEAPPGTLTHRVIGRAPKAPTA